MAKLSQSLLDQAVPMSPTTPSLFRRTDRDSDGRPQVPNNTMTPDPIPAVDVRWQIFAQTRRDMVDSDRPVLEALGEIRLRWCHAVGNHRLLFPNTTLVAFSTMYREPDGRLFKEAEMAIIDPRQKSIAETNKHWAQLVAQYRSQTENISGSLRSRGGDYNTVTESPANRAGRRVATKPAVVRRWNATVAREHDSDVDLNRLAVTPPSSDQAMGTPSELGTWIYDHMPDTDRITSRLRRNKARMEVLRKRCRVERFFRSWAISRRSYSARQKAWVSA